MLSVIIDEGNSFVKISIMSSADNIVKGCRVRDINIEILQDFIGEIAINRAIYCSVREKKEEIVNFLEKKAGFFLELNNHTPIPLQIDYSTPHTLGLDRIAAAMGAIDLFSEEDLLVIDLGSAITIDFIERGGIFRGGNITAGAGLRFKSLNDFTGKLPLCTLPNNENLEICSTSTKEAIENGIAFGIVCELESYIAKYKQSYPSLKIIFTGGDAKYFVSKFKIAIFADYELVNRGLYKILEYNNVKA